MARMIPSCLSPEIKSNAERKIFEWFRDDPDTEGWVVLHSLGITNHRTVLYGELDFFVIAPKLGVFALEVKGGRVGCKDGIWYFTNKYGQTNTKTRGPFAQANEGMFSLMDAIQKKYGKLHKLSNLLFGAGVMFPDITFDVGGTEGDQRQVFDSRDNKSVSRYIHRLSNYVRDKWEEQFGYFPSKKLPTNNDVKELVAMLRGDIDKVVSMGKQLSYVEDDLISLTNQQFRCLDQLEDNPRAIIRGAAGTGKTLLAIEDVKRSVANGQKVAFFCFNNMLGEWLKQYFKDQCSELRPDYVGTIHSWLFRVASRSCEMQPITDLNEANSFFQDELSLLALDSLENTPLSYDKIVIDEAQDIIGTSAFEVLDYVLKNGMERGKWVLFGDFTRQAIYQSCKPIQEIIDNLESKTSFIRYRLNINCRNTKLIGDEIKTITGFDSESYIWSKTDGVPVGHIVVKSGEFVLELEKLLSNLINDGIMPHNIIILSPVKRENSVVSQISKYKIENYKPGETKSIQFSTIHAYKGLEKMVVVLVDIDSFKHEQLMYVGLSRARSALFILETKKARAEYLEIVGKRLLNDDGNP